MGYMKEQTQYKLEYKLLFSLVVAGKSADFAQGVLHKLLPEPEYLDKYCHGSPMTYVRDMISCQVLPSELARCRSGNYAKLEKAFRRASELVLSGSLDLRLCTPQELEKVPGIGPKTSRFFILWTRPDARCAALDTHILKWLSYLGYKAPKSTPPKGKKYDELELAFLQEADKRKLKPSELDAMVWEWCWKGMHKTHGWPPELQPIK